LIVGRRFLETHFAVELDRDAHRRQRVQEQLAIADLLGRSDRCQRQIAADLEAALPELEWEYSYFLFWALCIGLAAGMFVWFKRRGWM